MWNAVLVLAVGVAGIAAIVVEGYRPSLEPVLLLFAVVAPVVGASGARTMRTRRVVALLLVAGIAGMVTQEVGTRLGHWAYPRPTHFFVAPAFAVASVAIYALARAWVGRLPAMPRWVRTIVGVGLAVLVARSTDPLWLTWYGFLLAGMLTLHRQTPASFVVALAVTSALFGGAAETLGARAGLWFFPGGSAPPWLPLGSWPLESLFHVGLSGVLAREKV